MTKTFKGYRLDLNDGNQGGAIQKVTKHEVIFVSHVSLTPDKKDVYFSHIKNLPVEVSEFFRHEMLHGEILVRLSMPVEAARKIQEGFRTKDPALMAILKEFGVVDVD